MQIEVLKSKIHRATVTSADLNYSGSITIDEDLMDAAGIVANERVYIVDNNNGERPLTHTLSLASVALARYALTGGSTQGVCGRRGHNNGLRAYRCRGGAHLQAEGGVSGAGDQQIVIINEKR